MTIRVLLVDDQPLVRAGIAMLLSVEPDIEVVGETSDGDQAVEWARRLRPDVVLMDVRMPGTDGVEATRALRKAGHEVPVLVLTARDAVTDRVGGLDAGADDYLTKPFALEELLARLRALLRRRPAGA